ncbi:MAG: hypothetical protein ACTSU5_08020 [Promethearchaeota archaeon]
MKSNPSLKLIVCTSCGLAVSRSELDRMYDKVRRGEDLDSREEDRRRKHKEYLNWYLGKKEE